MAAAPQQHLFVSNRSQTVRTTLGHSVTFVKGKATHVPKALHHLMVEKGILPCDDAGKPIPEKGEEAVEAAAAADAPKLAPDTAEERNEAIERAIRAIVERNSPKDFNAGGMPSPEAVGSAVGWKTDTKEVRSVWVRVRPELLAGGKVD